MRAWFLVVIGLFLVLPREADALIEGGTGNKPLRDPGWPIGSATIFNHQGRVAYWVGPPLGGGQWHSECRGDAKTFNAVLADFANVDAKVKRLVVHDGAGASFWLNPNREPKKRAEAKIDWTFTVWEQRGWQQQRRMPERFRSPAPNQDSPPAQIDVYTAGIRWADVVVPAGIEVEDRRLEAHGYTPADGLVIEGRVTDHRSKKPLVATVKLERVETKKAGGYEYPVVAETKTDADGKWAFKKAPTGWLRVVVEASAHAPKVAGYGRYDEEPSWHFFGASLTGVAAVSGRVIDDEGKPLEGVEVRLDDVIPEGGEVYRSPTDLKARTGADGNFTIANAPIGKTSVWVNKSGYVRAGLGTNITTPKNDVELTMGKSTTIRVTVDFTGREKPQGYIVNCEPEGGSKVGSYGGSGNIDAKNSMTFKDMPPGKYVFTGRPNPGSENQTTEPVTVALKAGQNVEIALKAK